jgi:hypothetical protein
VFEGHLRVAFFILVGALAVKELSLIGPETKLRKIPIGKKAVAKYAAVEDTFSNINLKFHFRSTMNTNDYKSFLKKEIS